MSHASGEVRIGNEVVGYFEYNGTCDMALARIFKTSEEMHANWRKHCDEPCSEHVCIGTEVTLRADYGSGIEWIGRACLNHMRICAKSVVPPQYEWRE